MVEIGLVTPTPGLMQSIFSILSLKFDWCSTYIIALLYVIWCYFHLCYEIQLWSERILPEVTVTQGPSTQAASFSQLTQWLLRCGSNSLEVYLSKSFCKLTNSCEIGLWWVPQIPIDDKSTLVQDFLVPSGKKPSPEPLLTQIYIVIWCH